MTVLMAVHNGERFLREAIDSILWQTFTDFEFLIINDGSAGTCREIILSYRDPRIRLLDNDDNLGLTKSLNRGLRVARGRLVARQDADDVSHPERLTRQVDVMSDFPEIAVLGTQARHINVDGRVVGSAAEWEKALSEIGIRWQVLFDSPFVHTSVVFRRDVIWDQLGGYNEDFTTGQDFELWSRVTASYGVRNLPERLVYFRVHPGSMSASAYTADRVEKVGTVMRSNLIRYVDQAELLDAWVRFWLCVTNPLTLPGQAMRFRTFDSYRALAWIYRQFSTAFPLASSNPDIRRHTASVMMRIACSIAPYNRRGSLRGYLRAYAMDRPTAQAAVLRFLRQFIAGRVRKDGRTQLRRLARTYPGKDGGAST